MLKVWKFDRSSKHGKEKYYGLGTWRTVFFLDLVRTRCQLLDTICGDRATACTAQRQCWLWNVECTGLDSWVTYQCWVLQHTQQSTFYQWASIQAHLQSI